MAAASSDNELEQVLTIQSQQQSRLLKLKRWQWWFLVAVNIFAVVAGQSAAVILGRFYFAQGGKSTWLATLVQTAGFPILYIPLFILHCCGQEPPPSQPSSSSLKAIALVYLVLGVIIAGDNMLYSFGLLYLSASTFSLICASQLAFNAIFSYFINSQKFTTLILNSVVVLSLSAALIAVNDNSKEPAGVSQLKYITGFVCALSASAIYSLILSLMQLSFQKVQKSENFAVVFNMQIYTSLVATCVVLVGLFASGDWKSLHGEMKGFGKGRVGYVTTLVSIAVCWQICLSGAVGLIFVLSSLFSNVVGTVALAVTPIAAVIVFHDSMNGVKIIAMLLAFWGFASYIYQNYLDDSKVRRSLLSTSESATTQNDSSDDSALDEMHRNL